MVNHPTYTTTNIQNGQAVTIDGGAYYIEINAMALIKLLQQTKAVLVNNGSANNIAIVGPSMGGQISRYALSYMEKKFEETGLSTWKHNTYLWISVDSPHLGANIPMGDQSLLYLLKSKGIDGAVDFYDKELSSPAAQQQLIEFHRPKLEYYNLAGINGWFPNYHLADQNMLNAQTTSQNMPTNRGNSVFQQHYNNQNSNGVVGSNGWPQNLRKIAITNGSLTGSKQTQTLNGSPFIPFANDGAKVFNLRGFQRVNINLPWPLGSITFRVHIASLEANNMPTYGTEARTARFKKLFDDRTTKAPNINPRGCMDNVPGGFFDAQADISDEVTSQDPVPGVTLTNLNNWSLNNLSITNIFKSVSQLLGGSEWYRHEFNPIHSFIPTFSALGHLQPNQSWDTPLNTNLTCPTNRKTPFDSYFGLAKNTQHTSFTKESVAWLLKELAGQPQNPDFPINEAAFSGSATVCINVNTTYSFGDICALPSPVSWIVSSNLQISSQTSTTITVQGTEHGAATITATFQNGQTFIKNIWIGGPVFNEFTFGSGTTKNLCFASMDCLTPGLQSTAIYASFSGLTSTELNNNANWQWVSENDLLMLNSNRNQTTICPLAVGTSGFKVRVQNACGWSDWVDFPSFEITECPTNYRQSSNTYKIYPNPSKEIVTIDLIDINNQPVKDAKVSGELFDIMGQSKSTVQIVDNKATFTVVGLSKGIYVLKIYINDQVESHQIAVE